MKKKRNDEKVLIEGANEMAEMMFNFFKDREDYQPYTFAVIGYAAELMMRFMGEQTGIGFDKLSKDFRQYLGIVHDDIKRIDKEDLIAN